jgi:Zn-finger nucleic acid-binding protein
MNCPRDGAPLEVTEVHGVSIRNCRTCGGMLLERGDLNRIAEPTTGDIEFSTLGRDPREHSDEFGVSACPRDGTAMDKVEFLVETNIILDHCPACRAFWLDGKELARINTEIEGLNEAERDIPDPPMVRLSKFFWELPFPH